MAKLPIVTSLKEVDSKSFGGQNIFELYSALINQIKANAKSSGIEKFFATPNISKTLGVVNWYTPYNGEIVNFNDLSQSQKKRAMEFVDNVNIVIEELAEKLRRKSDGNIVIASMLRQMLVTPDASRSIFMVGDNFVMGEWGCYPFGAVSDDFLAFKSLNKIDELTPNYFSPKHNEPLASSEELNDLFHSPKEELVSETSIYGSKFNWPQLLSWIFWVLLVLLILIFFLHLHDRWRAGYENRLRVEISALWDSVHKKGSVCFNEPRGSDGSKLPITEESNTSVVNTEVNQRLEANSVQKGNLNIALIWEGQSDLDLFVVDPAGNTICHYCSDTNSQGKSDIDANYCPNLNSCSFLNRTPVENISWSNDFPKGTYKIYVRFYSGNITNDAANYAVPFKVQVNGPSVNKVFSGIFEKNVTQCKNNCQLPPQFIASFEI